MVIQGGSCIGDHGGHYQDNGGSWKWNGGDDKQTVALAMTMVVR